MADIKELKQYVAHLENLRAARLTVWRDLRATVLPHRGIFPGDTDSARAKLTAALDTYNNAPLQSLRRGAAGLVSAMTPAALPWFRLGFTMDELEEVTGARQWLDAVEREIGKSLHTSGFYQEIHIADEECLGFGCMLTYLGMEETLDGDGMYVDEPHYLCCPCGTYSVGLTNRGELTGVARHILFTVSELDKRFGKEKLSKGIQKLVAKEPYTTVDVVHVVRQRQAYNPKKINNLNMPYESFFFEASGEQILQESGYREMPYFFTRWEKGTTLYGHGPGDHALGEIKTLNAMERKVLIGLDKTIDPPMRTPGGYRKRLNTNPGATNPINSMEPSAVAPLYEVGFMQGIAAVQQKIERIEQRVDDILLGRLFADPFLQEIPKGVTATAILAKRQQDAQMMGPAVASYNPHVLIPTIMRLKSLLDEAGRLPPLPPQLEQLGKMPRVLLKVEFVSPLAQAMRADTGDSTRTIIGDVVNLAGAKPEVLDKIDFDQAVDEMARAAGVPGSIIRSDDDVAAMRKQRAEDQATEMQRQQMMQMASMAGKLGGMPTGANTLAGDMQGKTETP